MHAYDIWKQKLGLMAQVKIQIKNLIFYLFLMLSLRLVMLIYVPFGAENDINVCEL